jgi:hypothetical protein
MRDVRMQEELSRFLVLHAIKGHNIKLLRVKKRNGCLGKIPLELSIWSKRVCFIQPIIDHIVWERKRDERQPPEFPDYNPKRILQSVYNF